MSRNFWETPSTLLKTVNSLSHALYFYFAKAFFATSITVSFSFHKRKKQFSP